MSNIQEEFSLLLREFHGLCRQYNIPYYIYAPDSSIISAPMPDKDRNTPQVIMKANDFFTFQKEFKKSAVPGRELESLGTNCKFPFLSIHYVNTNTLFYDRNTAGRVRYPGFYLTIHPLIPCPETKLLRHIFFYIRESLSASVLGSNYRCHHDLKGYLKKYSFKAFKFLYLLSGRHIASLFYPYGTKNETCKDYYLENGTGKRILISSSILLGDTIIKLKDNRLLIPMSSNQYTSYLSPDNTAPVEPVPNRIIVSQVVSCEDYLNSISGIVNLNRYILCKYYLVKSEQRQKGNRHIINKAYLQFRRTAAYYQLEHQYDLRIDAIYVHWNNNENGPLAELLSDYIETVREFGLFNLPIGYDKGLYDLVIKYLALTEEFSLCSYMIQSRIDAFNYIERMTAIKER